MCLRSRRSPLRWLGHKRVVCGGAHLVDVAPLFILHLLLLDHFLEIHLHLLRLVAPTLAGLLVLGQRAGQLDLPPLALLRDRLGALLEEVHRAALVV